MIQCRRGTAINATGRVNAVSASRIINIPYSPFFLLFVLEHDWNVLMLYTGDGL